MNELIFAFYMLVGTYTGGESEGIYVYGFDPETARTEYVGMARVDNPSYLTVSADRRTVYAVTENDGNPSANALGFDPVTGALTLLDSEQTGGSAPCNIATNGHVVVTANYGGGDISVFGVEKDGALSPVRQNIRLPEDIGGGKPSHMHCVKFSPDGRWLFASDLGTDKILRYDVDAGGGIDPGSLAAFDVPEGSGPRHFIFDSECRNLYLINEYSGAVIAFRYDGGDLERFQAVQADDADGRGSADIVLTPDGRWLYASNRLKNDGIAIFSVGGEGTLTRVGYRNTGTHPRNLSIAPGGRFLLSANRDSGSIEVFGIDYSTGALTPTGKDIHVDRPVCVMFVAAD